MIDIAAPMKKLTDAPTAIVITPRVLIMLSEHSTMLI
jgi:hypothetical protein